MRYSASDKTEIIRLVEQSHLPARRTLEKLGIPRSSFYRWYDRHQRGGPEALADRPSRPDRVWNRIPEAIRSQIVDLALDQPELSPRELAVRFTDEAEYFVSEASVYRLLKAHDLITSPAYIVIKAAEEFRDKTTAPNQLWQTDFTYLKITGWGWCYLSTVLGDFSRFIVAWKLCATMKALKHVAMADAGLSLEQVAPHIQFLTRRNADSYLVVYYGPVPLIRSSNRGEPVPNENDLTTGPARLVPGYLDEQIFSGEALLSFLSTGGARVAIVLPLHLITERVERIFAEAD